MSSAEWLPSCLSLNVLNWSSYVLQNPKPDPLGQPGYRLCLTKMYGITVDKISIIETFFLNSSPINCWLHNTVSIIASGKNFGVYIPQT